MCGAHVVEVTPVWPCVWCVRTLCVRVWCVVLVIVWCVVCVVSCGHFVIVWCVSLCVLSCVPKKKWCGVRGVCVHVCQMVCVLVLVSECVTGVLRSRCSMVMWCPDDM